MTLCIKREEVCAACPYRLFLPVLLETHVVLSRSSDELIICFYLFHYVYVIGKGVPITDYEGPRDADEITHIFAARTLERVRTGSPTLDRLYRPEKTLLLIFRRLSGPQVQY